MRVAAARGATTLDVPLERYVAGVLAGESSVFQSAEALKTMAVAARTYAIRQRGRHPAEGFDFCATTHCQRFDPDAASPRLASIAAATAGELLWYQGKPAFTPYTRDCGGRTEDASAVWPDLAAPYLKTRDDPYCARAAPAPWQWSAAAPQIADALHLSGLRVPRHLEAIGIAQRTASGRAFALVLGGKGESVRVGAGAFRFAMGRALGWNTVRSDRYEIGSANGRIVFHGTGSGHGVGLCQAGAERWAWRAALCREILAFYYPGTALGVTARGISWQRLGGEQVALLTTNPQADGAVLASAERHLRALSNARTGRRPRALRSASIPISIASAMPPASRVGWRRTPRDGVLHLQPAALLRSRGTLESTLRHELLHVLVESQASASAAAPTPLWFREGLVEFLESPPRGSGPARPPADADLAPHRRRRASAGAPMMPPRAPSPPWSAATAKPQSWAGWPPVFRRSEEHQQQPGSHEEQVANEHA